MGDLLGQAVGVAVLGKQPARREADLRPVLFHKAVVGLEQVGPVCAQEQTALAVDGGPVPVAPAEENWPLRQRVGRTGASVDAHGDAAIGLYAHAGHKIGLGAEGFLKFGKKPARALIVVPDVVAGAGEGIRALEAVKPPVRETKGGGGGEGGDVRDRAIEQPARQGGIVVSPAPQVDGGDEGAAPAGQLVHDGGSGGVAGGIPASLTLEFTPVAQLEIREVPDHREGEAARLAGIQPERRGERADLRFIEGSRAGGGDRGGAGRQISLD